MDTSDVCPTEDAIREFLDYLVEPLLPAKSSIRKASLDKQKEVAKQVHAVVLLYNYYHRKGHPHLEYLGFEPFCKLALVLKPTLKSYLNLMLRSDDTELSDLEKRLSLTEKAIKDACDISISLDASRNSPSLKGWPVSRVAVLLIDPRKEKCFLQNGSITQGVWSMIEKDVNESYCSSGGSIEAKHMNKRKRVPDLHLQDELGVDKGLFQKLAFSAVKEATNGGISQGDLTVIESHIVCSLSKEKTATCFYIMQSIHAKEDNGNWIPIKDVIDSLQGPLFKRSSSYWMFTSVVEYFHLLPYARVISHWFSRLCCRDVFPNSFLDQDSVPELVNVKKECSEPEDRMNGSAAETSKNTTSAESEKQNEKNELCANDFLDAIDGPLNMYLGYYSAVYSQNNNRISNRNQINGSAAEIFKNPTSAESEKQNETNELCSNEFLDVDGPPNMDKGYCCAVYSEKNSVSGNAAEKVQHDGQPKKMKSCAERDLNGMTNVAKFELVNSTLQNVNHLKGQKVANKKAAWNNVISCQGGIPAGNHALVIHESNSDYAAKLQNVIASKEHILVNYSPVIHESNSKYSAKLQNAIASKEHILTETAMRVLLCKRDKLVLQLRDIGDEIAQYDKKIQTILNGGKDDLELKIDSIIEGCNDVFLKRNGMPEEDLSKRNPCQELDGVCNEMNWILPTYQVFPSDGRYQASVTVKGKDFMSSVGDVCPNSCEARGSAAARILAKLRTLLNADN